MTKTTLKTLQDIAKDLERPDDNHQWEVTSVKGEYGKYLLSYGPYSREFYYFKDRVHLDPETALDFTSYYLLSEHYPDTTQPNEFLDYVQGLGEFLKSKLNDK